MPGTGPIRETARFSAAERLGLRCWVVLVRAAASAAPRSGAPRSGSPHSAGGAAMVTRRFLPATTRPNGLRGVAAIRWGVVARCGGGVAPVGSAAGGGESGGGGGDGGGVAATMVVVVVVVVIVVIVVAESPSSAAIVAIGVPTTGPPGDGATRADGRRSKEACATRTQVMGKQRHAAVRVRVAAQQRLKPR